MSRTHLLQSGAAPLPVVPPQPQPGDPCQACPSGKLRVYSSKHRGLLRVQYLHCNTCGHRPLNNRRIVALRRHRRRAVAKKCGGCGRGSSGCGGRE